MKILVVLWSSYLVRLYSGTTCGESLDNVQVLDISNVDSSKITVDEGSEDGVSYKSYIPKANKHPTKVVDGNKELWKGSSDKEKCTLADVYTGKEYVLIKLSIRTGIKSVSKCFKKVDREWEGVEQVELLEIDLVENSSTRIKDYKRDNNKWNKINFLKGNFKW